MRGGGDQGEAPQRGGATGGEGAGQGSQAACEVPHPAGSAELGPRGLLAAAWLGRTSEPPSVPQGGGQEPWCGAVPTSDAAAVAMNATMHTSTRLRDAICNGREDGTREGWCPGRDPVERAAGTVEWTDFDAAK
jgi:hypothetical protein